MKGLFWAGLLLLILGVGSLFISIPHTENHGVKAGDVNIGVQTHHSEPVSRAVSIVLIVGGIVLTLAAGAKRS